MRSRSPSRKLMDKTGNQGFSKRVKYLILYNTKDTLDLTYRTGETHADRGISSLVFIVVFIFLQDFRSTLIPAIAVPVAIIRYFLLYLLAWLLH